MIKTKIVATLGPASANRRTVETLINGGVDVFRLNFSHGSLEDHRETLGIINELRESTGRTVAVMGDLCGPKIRTSVIIPDDQIVHEGERIIIEPSLTEGSPVHFGTNYQQFCQDVNVDNRILIDDGKITLRIIQIDEEKVECEVIVGGLIKSRKGVNLPDSKVSAPSITDRDWQCADWAIEHDLDFLALSFVRGADEIAELKERLQLRGSAIKVASKIEKPEAIVHLEDIVRISDVVLVARGDLGVEMALERVPLIQKQITRLCRKLGKPVIVATQMLESMISSPTPTRAEVSDVANAIMDFTDAVMLSGETAVGKYPLAAIHVIDKIARTTESYLDEINDPRPKVEAEAGLEVSAAMACSVAQIIDDVGAGLTVTWSQTGSATRLLSKARIDVPVLAFCPDPKVCNQMMIEYGVIPVCRPPVDNPAEFIKTAEKYILEKQLVKPGDKIIVIADEPLTGDQNSHAVIIHTVG